MFISCRCFFHCCYNKILLTEQLQGETVPSGSLFKSSVHCFTGESACQEPVGVPNIKATIRSTEWGTRSTLMEPWRTAEARQLWQDQSPLKDVPRSYLQWRLQGIRNSGTMGHRWRKAIGVTWSLPKTDDGCFQWQRWTAEATQVLWTRVSFILLCVWVLEVLWLGTSLVAVTPPPSWWNGPLNYEPLSSSSGFS